jgi:5-methyltetrahydrofolate--homocysteine methyltransferase
MENEPARSKAGITVTNRIQQLRNRLNNGDIMLADGAAGTMLMSAGLPAGTPPDFWNIEKPEAIIQLHKAYIAAGSSIILTNTFGANRIKLERAGLSGRVREINYAGAGLAREAAGDRAFVAGDIGPTGELMEPLGPLTFEVAVAAFADQAQALVEGGVDALWIETMDDLEEARAAVTGVRQVTDLPLFCTLSFGRKGRTMMGVSPKQAAETLFPLGLTAMGANCGEGLEVVSAVLSQMAAVLPGVPLIAKPNAGLPKMVGGETIYDTGPAEFADRAIEFTTQGAQILGACCGSNPDFIKAMAAKIKPFLIE